MLTTRLTLLAGTLLLAACHKNPEVPASTDSGHRYLVSLASGEQFSGYVEADAPAPDQPIWVVDLTALPTAPALLARLDTAGQPLVGRTLRLPGGTSFPVLTALADGGVLVAQVTASGVPLVRLSATGSPLWSKTLTTPLASGESLVFDDVVAVGNDALFVARTDLQGPLLTGRIAADGSQATASTVALPAPVGGAANRLVQLAALPTRDGAVLLRAQDESSVLVARLDASGQPVWVRQLSLGNLGGTGLSTSQYHLAVAPDGSLGVLVSAGGTTQVVRLTGGGVLLTATSYAAASGLTGAARRLALGPQGQAGWLHEVYKALYFYTADAQGQPQTARQVAGNVTYPRGINLTAFGLVGFGARGAYALGTQAGPDPTNIQGSSLNLLHLSATGRAGCQLGEAPALTATPVPSTQLLTLPMPTTQARSFSLSNFTLNSTAEALTSAPACP